MKEITEDYFEKDIIHPVCCGIDVHKTWNFAAIVINDVEHHSVHYKTERFSNFAKGQKALTEWLKMNHCTIACMESTGQYWYPVFDAIEDAGLHPVVAHPKYTKPQHGKKSDPSDAIWIGKSYASGRVIPSFIPPRKFRNLRGLVRCYVKLSYAANSNKNRVLNCLTDAGIKLDDTFSDVFGKSSRAIVNHIIQHPRELFDVTPFIDKSCKTPIPKIQEAIAKVPEMSDAILKKMEIALEIVDKHEEYRKEIQETVEKELGEYQHILDLIRTVPGFNTNSFTAVRVLVEIGPDIHVFPTAKHFCSWAGVGANHDSSAKKVKSRKISKGGQYLKPLLVNIAKAVVRSKNHPEITRRFNRIKNRRGYMRAIIAICKMFLTAIWNILSKDEPYRADGYMTKNNKAKKIMTTSQALALLRSRGYTIIDHNSEPLTTTGS